MTDSNEKEVILCVDDDTTVLRVLQVLLTREGYDVLTASSGQHGLELLKTKKVDLVVCDQKMPGMNGWEFFRAMSRQYPEVVRIMLSGYTDFEGLVKAINEGEIFRFVSKPWDNDTLRSIIRSALDRGRVIEAVDNIVKDVCQMVKLAGGVETQTSKDQQCLILRIGDENNALPTEVVFKFLRALFGVLNVKEGETLGALSGAIEKNEGAITITVNIGKGVLLKIQVPHLSE